MSERGPKIHIFEPKDVGPREWGREILIAHVPGLYIGKLLVMKAGTRGGLQYHRKKNEAQYLYAGTLKIECDNGDGKLSEVLMTAGQAWHIPPGAVHRETALTDCVIIEVSNPVFNDRVRVEDQYGEAMHGGLPTTDPDQIEIR